MNASLILGSVCFVFGYVLWGSFRRVPEERYHRLMYSVNRWSGIGFMTLGMVLLLAWLALVAT